RRGQDRGDGGGGDPGLAEPVGAWEHARSAFEGLVPRRRPGPRSAVRRFDYQEERPAFAGLGPGLRRGTKGRTDERRLRLHRGQPEERDDLYRRDQRPSETDI